MKGNPQKSLIYFQYFTQRLFREKPWRTLVAGDEHCTGPVVNQPKK